MARLANASEDYDEAGVGRILDYFKFKLAELAELHEALSEAIASLQPCQSSRGNAKPNEIARDLGTSQAAVNAAGLA